MSIAQARRLALALPETAEAPHFDHTSFRAKKKIFATSPPGGAHLERAWAHKAPARLKGEPE